MKQKRRNKSKPVDANRKVYSILEQIDRFKLTGGKMPVFIITTKKNKKALIQWLNSAPLNGFNFLEVRGIPVVSPEEILVV